MAVISNPALLPFGAGHIRNTTGAVAGPSRVRTDSGLPGTGLRKDLYFGGADYIAGVVTINDVPRLAYVRIHDQKTGLLIAGGLTDNSGNFRFNNLRSDLTYYAVAIDAITGEQAVIFDRI